MFLHELVANSHCANEKGIEIGFFSPITIDEGLHGPLCHLKKPTALIQGQQFSALFVLIVCNTPLGVFFLLTWLLLLLPIHAEVILKHFKDTLKRKNQNLDVFVAFLHVFA